jgi:hypothetical protein
MEIMMAEEKPIASSRTAGSVGPRSPVAVSLTAKEVFGILRRHILLIIFLTVMGLGAGGVICPEIYG